MGAIEGLTGLAGGANGTGFAGPGGTTINAGTNGQQVTGAYGGAQNSLASQQALLAAIQGQNGLGNQSQVYGQLQGVANGTGPNPAQAMLQNATGQNVANQAALMAGQRGAGSNVGLMARQAGQQGAGIQQNALGQASALQAQQSLGALGQAGQMANRQAANQIGATTANTQANQSEQQLLLNSMAQQNAANVGMQGNINNANAGLANTTMQGQQALIGGAIQGAGSGAAMAAAQGGVVPGYEDGGPVAGPQSSFGQFLNGWASPGSQPQIQMEPLSLNPNNPGADKLKKAASSAGGKGGNPMLGSSGVQATGANEANAGAMSDAMGAGMMVAAQGGSVGSQLKSGGHVPGKAIAPGNSYSNDTVKALLSPGEVVIPRSVMQSGNPVDGAARFVAAVLAKKGKK